MGPQLATSLLATPSLPANGSTVKFSGTETDHYSFPPDTKQLSGSFSATTIIAGETITYGGAPPVAVKPGSTTGSYQCVGSGLTLSFPAPPALAETTSSETTPCWEEGRT